MLHIHQYDNTTGKPNRQPEDIYEGVPLISPKISEGYFDIVIEHGFVGCSLLVVSCEFGNYLQRTTDHSQLTTYKIYQLSYQTEKNLLIPQKR